MSEFVPQPEAEDLSNPADDIEDMEEDRGDMEQEDPVNDMEDAKDRLDDLTERLMFLEKAQDESPLPELLDKVFPSRLTAFTSGTGGAWVERFASGTVMTDYTGSPRFASAAGNLCALFGPAETDFVTVEQITADGIRMPSIPSGVVDVYLTDLGSGSYDGYLDAGKTVKVFAAQTGQPATAGATKGLARLVGTVWRFVGPVNSDAVRQKMGSITGYTGAGPVNWVYQASFVSGGSANAYNSKEPLNGSPGSLGVTVGTDGSVTGTSCFVKPVGVDPRPRVFTWDTVNSRWSFTDSNSAG